MTDNFQRGSKWEILHIPSEIRPPPDKQPTVDVITSTIEPRVANSVVRQLNQIAPLDNLPHVKRVQKKHIEGGESQLSIILCLAPENGCIDGIPEGVKNLINSFQLSTSVAKVCKNAAISKEEWEAQCKLWPTSYHPPKNNIGGITGFSTEDSDLVFHFMKHVIDLAKSGGSLVINAAVIVDPSSNQVISSACDQLYSRHTSTVNENVNTCNCIAGKCQNSPPDLDEDGTIQCSQQNGSLIDLKNRKSNVSCLHPLQWGAEGSFQLNHCWHPLRHAAMVAIELSAARDRDLFPNTEEDDNGSPEIDSSLCIEISQTKRLKTDPNTAVFNEEAKGGRDKQKTRKFIRWKVGWTVDNCNCDVVQPQNCSFSKPYLCTGYDMYLVWEPCTMCAMALVHQRLRRIFFAFPNSQAGALGGVHRLHGQKSLNHHYAVFRVLIPSEASILGTQVAGQIILVINGVWDALLILRVSIKQTHRLLGFILYNSFHLVFQKGLPLFHRNGPFITVCPADWVTQVTFLKPLAAYGCTKLKSLSEIKLCECSQIPMPDRSRQEHSSGSSVILSSPLCFPMRSLHVPRAFPASIKWSCQSWMSQLPLP